MEQCVFMRCNRLKPAGQRPASCDTNSATHGSTERSLHNCCENLFQ